jgi:hypothetical protein
LSRAASGRELPSLNVTLAYVTACGGDVEAWRNRWTALAATLRGPHNAGRPTTDQPTGGQPTGGRPTADLPAANLPTAGLPTMPADAVGTGQAAGPPARGGADLPQPPADGSRPGEPHRRWRRPARLLERVTIAGLGAALGATLVAVVHDAPRSPGRPRPSIAASTARPGPVVVPRDGLDPTVAGCAGDATTIATASVRLPRRAALPHMVLRAGTVIGTVELRYSPHCRAGWSRVTPAAALDSVRTGTMAAAVSRASDKTYSAFGAAKVIEFYTDVLLMDGSCLRASGTIMIAGVTAAARTACTPVPTR